ncbi:MAG TPA: sugar ABC transporter ATP-binding protein [Phycisphaerae bacterium]|nr:sugar ABC transporter ATP-binding protein [Phycisphaerae bacterium]
MAVPLLRFEGITKRFPGVVALAEVSFEIQSGESHALIGENGAGKSTLGRIVAGIHRPDGGRLFLDGREVSFRSPREAVRAGISIVHQELSFCPNLSVAENLCLGDMPSSRGRVRWREMRTRAHTLLQQVGLQIDPATLMGDLSTGQVQMVQIAGAVGRRARIVVMDEPTSSLSQTETSRLFEIVAHLRRQGVTIVYISHRLEEISRLCDRVTVLRDGRFIQTLPTASASTDEIVRLMIGRPFKRYFPDHVARRAGQELLVVKGLSSPGKFEDLSFVVRSGEVVGMAGLVGAGRSEAACAIFGIDRYTEGSITLRGRPLLVRSPREAIERGIGMVPEDRQRQGLVLSMSCRENLSLSFLARLRRWLLVDHHRDRMVAQEYFWRLQVRAPDVDTDIAGLSGGNQQKIAVAKWLAQQCEVLIFDEPTRGVDIGAKAEIHALIDQLATQGHGIILISSELPEILNLSTRIVVLAKGRIVGELQRERADEESLIRLMTQLAS